MKRLSYDDGTYHAEVDIRPATTRDGITREYLMYSDMEKLKDPVELRAKQLFATLTAAADIVALEKSGLPFKLTVESLLDLPGILTTLWAADVFEVNPHWQYGISADELETIQKKANQPSTGLEASTEPQARAKSRKTL